MTIFRELLSNALKFADKDSPKVKVWCQRQGSQWRFQVIDNGHGVTEEDSEICLRLFGKLHSRDEYPGLGVGLTVAHLLAEKYNAKLHLGKTPEGDGQVTLCWPIKEG